MPTLVVATVYPRGQELRFEVDYATNNRRVSAARIVNSTGTGVRAFGSVMKPQVGMWSLEAVDGQTVEANVPGAADLRVVGDGYDAYLEGSWSIGTALS